MANPHLGEVALVVGSETYKVSLSLNAMCELEEAFQRPLLDVIGDLEEAQTNPRKLKVTMLRTLVWGALRDHHPDLSLKDAGLIAGKAGLPAVMEAIVKAIRLAFPPAEEAGGAEGNPPQAAG